MRYSNQTIRQMERESIEGWIRRAANDHIFADHRSVLDYGCGVQPYRGHIEDGGGDYTGYNRAVNPGLPHLDRVDVGPDQPLELAWDVIVCTQVLQYIADVPELFEHFYRALTKDGGAGYLVLTYATNWDEVETEDLHRHTYSGIHRLLKRAGFWIHAHERRAEVELGGFRFPLGGAVIAQAQR